MDLEEVLDVVLSSFGVGVPLDNDIDRRKSL